MSNARPPLMVFIQAHLRADPRKTIVLAALVVVMVVVYVRLFAGGTPEEAVAQPTPLPEDSAAGAVQGVAVTPAERVTVPQSMQRKLLHDPFEVDLSRFLPARTGIEEGVTASAPATDDPSAAIREAAAKLTLQSTISGGLPAACISGQVVRPGEEVDGFVLERIEPRRVFLRRGSVRVTLLLK